MKLKDQCNLTLIDSRDALHHNMGAQRSSVQQGLFWHLTNFFPTLEKLPQCPLAKVKYLGLFLSLKTNYIFTNFF